MMGGSAVIQKPLRRLAQAVYRVRNETPGPEHVRAGEGCGDEGVRAIGGVAAAGGDRVDVGLRAGQSLRGGGLEAVEEFADGLVGSLDTRDGHRARDDAHLVGGVARIVCLPQRVRSPPAPHVGVDGGHERDWLARGAEDREELGDVRRVQRSGGRVRVAGGDRLDDRVRVLDARRCRELRRDGSGVAGVEARLGALDELVESVAKADVEPGGVLCLGDGLAEVAAGVEDVDAARLPGLARLAHAQCGKACEDVGVRHLVQIAEVRLGGGVDRGDDFLAALGDRVRIAGNLVEETPGAGGRIVDLVDVRAELAAARGHPARGVACADPAGDALGVDEHLLDLRARGRLECRHRGGADKHGVHGHRGETVVERPLPGEIVGRALGRAYSAADGKDDVRPAT